MNDIETGWEHLEAQAAAAILPPPVATFKHYKPLSNAVDIYVKEAQDGERIYFGIPEFDAQIRGVGSSHLCIINGYAHSGKTLLLAHILRHNADKRVALFTPDEPAQLVLAKLAAAAHRVPADEIEDRIAAGDEAAIELLRSTAEDIFPNLIVFDKPLTGQSMEAAIAEAEQVWGGKCQLGVIDYLELLQAGETVPQKADFVKGFGSRHELALIVLHQTSRSAGADGKRMTISSGAFGGEQHATFQLGVWRKKADVAAQLIEMNDKIARAQNGATDQQIEKRDSLQHELERAEFTLTVAITKNKRPGRRDGREEIDFELFGDTGVISPLGASDLPVQYRELLDRRRAQTQQQPPIDEYELTPLPDTGETF